MKTEHSKIIEALGDAAALARRLGLPKPTVQAWKAPNRGIPPKIQLAYPRLIAKGRRLVAQMEKSKVKG